ncbi:ATP-dependent nuclease subunit B lacks Walker A motif [Methanonatronarchaeum thermophilum]|uniref:ATP-dependent nuclease subunit B lacks Walker A motif n=1 Tax=Methanonatronarchaeum thermophilum TaxID=1927129 RepID=A0A1Y3GAH8_9EURY|nr:PD-(D/E)XK nuclease family protein [Methanonatronarchaeum thermophilum]OUJ18428.1 ATP-dependent nuclease subunit B lacks Walker A motif [Methanonatronarchaeum thermophilum]
MEVKKSLSIDSVYDEVSDYDLVLTVEAPLAESLEHRVDRAFLGLFSTTPRRLVYEEHPGDLLDKRGLFHIVVDETGIGWKKSAYLLDNAVDCWIETGDPRDILRYPMFSGEEMREVVEVLESTDNIYRAMNEYQVDEQDVAVVGFHQFKQLDKKVLPNSFDVIDVFQDCSVDLPRLSVFNSSVEIVKALSNNVSKWNAGETAFVLNPDSEYQPLVVSMLESRGIPYMTQLEITENMDLRNFFLYCRTAIQKTNLKVGEIQPLLKAVNIDIENRYNQQYIKNIDNEELNRFISGLRSIESMSFEEAIDFYSELVGRDIDILVEFYSDVGLLGETVSEHMLDLVEYYLEVFDIPWKDGGNGGVLLVSPGNVAWVDRPFVFHIGLDSSWSLNPPNKPWIDRERFETTKIKDFMILLQNRGSYYLVQDRYMNEEVVPCSYFNEIFDAEFESFTDLPHKRYNEEVVEELDGFDKIDLGIESNEVSVFSQSDLNTFVECPRNYYFKKLISTPDQDYFRKGNLFHDFAELYYNHPQYTENNLTEIIELMVDEIKPLVSDVELPLIKTEFLVGTKNIMEFIDETPDIDVEVSGYSKKYINNVFFKKLDLPIESNLTEVWFEDTQLGCKGKIDLIRQIDELVDYKSGRKHSKSNIVRKSNVELFEDRPNFQALMYLYHHRKIHPNQKLDFIFYYFLDNIKDNIKGEGDYKDNITRITYYPNNFNDQLPKKTTYEWLCKTSKARKKFLKKLGYKNYKKALKNIEISKKSQYDRELIKEECSEKLSIKFSEHLTIGWGEDVTQKQLEKQTKGILSKYTRFRTQNYFKEDLDQFQDFLKNKITELNQYKQTTFPVGNPNLKKIDNRDLLII